MSKISWLHLSDWHQGAPDWDRSVVLEKLLDRVARRTEIAPELAKLEFIIFSGDLAFSGTKAQFDAAWNEFLEPLARLTGVPLDRIFIVPGNHDLERSRFTLLPTALNQGLKTREEILPWLVDLEKRQRLLDPFQSYSEFLVKRLPHQTAWACGSLFEIDGTTVGIAGLNSAMLCGRLYPDGTERDYGGLVVGEPQFYEALQKVKGADLRIFVLHHPFDWLAEFDRNNVRHQLLNAAHFILSGHMHQPEIRQEFGTRGHSILIPAGASYDRRNSRDQNYVNSFNFVHLDLENSTGIAFVERWSEFNTEWAANSEVGNGGKFSFKLPTTPTTAVPVKHVIATSVALRSHQIRTIKDQLYCLIPAGSFKMGNPPEIAEELSRFSHGKYDSEAPQHEVWVDSLLIARHPVTNSDYKKFVDATGHAVPFRDDALSRSMNWDLNTKCFPAGRDHHPVTLVSWYDAQAYCQWLGGRLPTEAEWEKASRGDDGRQWPWGNTWQIDRCNAGTDGFHGTTSVFQFAERGQSPYGVWDMAGNVWEWTSSHPDPYPYDAYDGREAKETGGRRVHRGGAWLLPPSAVRCSFRGFADPSDFGFNLGFRVAFSGEP